MALFLSIAALLVLALLATSKRFYRLRRSRFGAAAIAGGWLATGVGTLLGPAVGGLITADAVFRATPLLSVGLGWIGLMVGLQARRDVLSKLPAVIWKLAGLDALLTIVVIGAALFGVSMFIDQPGIAGFTVAFTLFAAASIGWSMETRSLGIESSGEGQKRAVLLRAAGGLSAIAAVALFGVAAAILIVPTSDPLTDAAPRSLGLRVLSLGSACAVGALLAVVAKEALRLAGNHRAEMLVVFLGVVGLAAGISADLGVSPLLPAMITGATLANLRTSGPSDSIANTAVFGRFILQAEHVVATIFALLAGVLLDPRVLLPGAAVVAALVLVRLLIKPAVFAFVDSSNEADRDSSWLARTASIRQSPVAVALAVSLVVLASVEDAQRLLTIVVLVGIACDLLASVAARRRSPAEETLNADATL
jgi:hypothetical protein